MKQETNMELKSNHRRFYEIAGITIQVESDLPIKDNTFQSRFKPFQVYGQGKDNIVIKHHFFLPDVNTQNLGKMLFCSPPWAIYYDKNTWTYLGIMSSEGDMGIYRVAFFNNDFTRTVIHNESEKIFHFGNWHSLTMFPTDQILLSQVLANREACYMHSSGMVFKQKGILFVGHSEAGKSTMVKLLKNRGKILCDDRIIIRNWPNEIRIHGTWSHGEVPDVSANSAPLKAIFFLEKSSINRILPISNRHDITRKLLSCLIRPVASADWWVKTISLIEKIVCLIPSYTFYFDQSGKVKDMIDRLIQDND